MTNKVYEKFKKEVSSHRMIIENDNEVHRSIYFSEKGNSAYHFRIVTWPGHLAISGDMGDFVFARTLDMFDFFRSKSGEINIGYWAEKLTADSVFGGGYKEFCWDSFLSDFKESLIRQNDTINEQEVLNYIEGAISYVEHDEHGAIQLVRDWGGGCNWDCGEITLDPYLISLGKKVTSRFIWCLHAIVWAIAKYDEYTEAGKSAAEKQLGIFGQWQPIETALKVGESEDVMILLLTEHGDVVSGNYQRHRDGYGCWYDWGSEPIDQKITHWMPMPETPSLNINKEK